MKAVLFALMLACAAATTGPAHAEVKDEGMTAMARPFSHFVLFRLKQGGPAANAALIAGANTYLRGHAGEVSFTLSERASDMTRDVNVQDYDVALHIVFKDKPAHDAYQVSPRHKTFIETLQANWANVRVIDSYLAPAPTR